MTKQLKEIEIPLGAKDSELCGWEYTIPEGMEATIVDNKIVVKKKKSEDEQHRKWILEYLYDGLQKSDVQFFDQFKSAIAWLEKQGEKKSIWHNEDEEPQRGKLILLIMQSGTPIVVKIIEPNHTFNHGERWAYIDDLLEKKGETFTKKDVDDAYLKGICDTKQELEKQGEQKSQRIVSAEAKEAMYDKPAWSEEDERMYKKIEKAIDSYYAPFSRDTEEMSEWLKSLKERYTWKPSDLPHWKKIILQNDNTTGFNSDYFCHNGYCINYKELFEKLPKDD